MEHSTMKTSCAGTDRVHTVLKKSSHDDIPPRELMAEYSFEKGSDHFNDIKYSKTQRMPSSVEQVTILL